MERKQQPFTSLKGKTMSIADDLATRVMRATNDRVEKINNKYEMGDITIQERYAELSSAWNEARNAQILIDKISKSAKDTDFIISLIEAKAGE